MKSGSRNRNFSINFIIVDYNARKQEILKSYGINIFCARRTKCYQTMSLHGSASYNNTYILLLYSGRNTNVYVQITRLQFVNSRL